MIKIKNLRDITPSDVLKRSPETVDVSGVVKDIIDDVIKNGDNALLKYGEKFDRAHLTSLRVSQEEIDKSVSESDPVFIEILTEAAENIREYHKMQLRQGYKIEKSGITLGQRIMPLERVGLYVPGGTAAYPSTVLMDAIPAKIAGVKEIAMVTPPRSDGSVNPDVLAAAHIAGVTEIYKTGGAAAIAALCYGTESIKRVDKIVGPGNMYVAEAKRQVFGNVSIDMIAGPSEILIIADETANPAFVAADLLSQAEHDKMAAAILITTSQSLAEKTALEIERQLALLPRREIAEASVNTYSMILLTNTMEEATQAANEIAPEHLELCVDEPFELLPQIRNAGSVFLGKYCPEALGDYFAGTNHTLPTNGTARFASPLSVDDFVKKSSYMYYTDDALEKVYKKIDYFAKKEGLTAHAKSASIRFEGEPNE
ncbi:MAG: histidinol dehydrogenase [Clostridia bacterium]|nr:histidinol dehydrogenase [Clostridia bacterium]